MEGNSNVDTLELPYELQIMDLKKLEAKIHKDELGMAYAEIHNPKFQILKINKWGSLEYLKVDLKRQMYYFLLKINEIRYCTICEKILILDTRKYVDICSTCRDKSEEPEISEYVKITKDFIQTPKKIEEKREEKSIDDICKEAKDEADKNPIKYQRADDLFSRISAIKAE